MDSETVLEKIRSKLTFGKTTAEDFATNSESVADGGWVNTEISVLVDGEIIGTACVGCWVYGKTDNSMTADVHDRVIRRGFSIDAYVGNERSFEATNDRPWAEIFGLTEEEDLLVADWEIEAAVLDETEAEDQTDYEAAYRSALADRLAETNDDHISSMLDAVRALDH
jgi:hypothetical protein